MKKVRESNSLMYSVPQDMDALASFPGLPCLFCSSVSVDNNTQMRKGGEKRGKPGTIHHVSDVRWTQGWTWGGGGGVVVSAGPEGCSSSSQLSSNAPWLVKTLR